MDQPIWQLDATALAQALALGQLDAVQILQSFRDRIEAVNPRLNAVICHNPRAAADASASAARRAEDRALSPIDGVPILIKDNLAVAGLPATWGCPLYRDHVPAEDELPVARLRQAGAIILGKTNVPEFTVEGFTDNRLFGPTRNPWNPALTPGGSSGGSVAAVAAGMCPWSIGTDGGGSIRRPAAYANLVGLKPSIGRVARGGGLPQLLLDMEVVGPMSRSVRDQALLLGVLAGADRRDHRSLQLPAFDAGRALREPDRPLRILAVERFGDAPLDPVIADRFAEVAGLLAQSGHELRRSGLPLDIDELNELWPSIGHIGLARLMQHEPDMRRFASAKYVAWADTPYPAAHLLRILELIQSLRDQAARVFADLDLIMTPSCAAMPWPIGVEFPDRIDGRAVGPRGSAVYTGWVNACGHPAISLPAPLSPQGLPIGIQFVAGFGQEELLLQLGAQLERQLAWSGQWPDLGGA